MTPLERARKVLIDNDLPLTGLGDELEDSIEIQIREAVLEERKECAKIADDTDCPGYSCGEVIANAIRERGGQ